MINFILQKIVGTQNERELKRLHQTVSDINALEPQVSQLSDDKLRLKTAEFKERIKQRLAAEGFDEIEDAKQRKIILQ